jgi:hypothetical protein
LRLPVDAEAERGPLLEHADAGALIGRGGDDLDLVLRDPPEERMRLASVSRSSPSCTGTAACAMIGPVSVPASTKWTVQPVTRTP